MGEKKKIVLIIKKLMFIIGCVLLTIIVLLSILPLLSLVIFTGLLKLMFGNKDIYTLGAGKQGTFPKVPPCCITTHLIVSNNVSILSFRRR